MAILNPTVTELGLAAVFNAQNDGVELALTHVAFGLAAYDPVGNETTLQNEVKRVPISSGMKITPSQIRLSAVWSSDTEEAAVNEIGFFAGDVLFAVISRSTGGPYVYKTTEADLVFSYDWKLTVVPANSVTIVADSSQNAFIGLLSAHEGADSPHPQYLKKVELGTAVTDAVNSAINGSALDDNVSNAIKGVDAQGNPVDSKIATALDDKISTAIEGVAPDGSVIDSKIATAIDSKIAAAISEQVGNSAFLSTSDRYVLPPVAGKTIGYTFRVRKSRDVTPVIAVEGAGNEFIYLPQGTDTEILYDVPSELIFLLTGSARWEVIYAQS